MLSKTVKLSDVARGAWKPFALYTVENRAIPSAIDGLKSSQRFYLYSSILNTPRDFSRVSAVCGIISEYGYNHGEGAAGGAGQLMAASWNNNVTLIEPSGAFGTRLVQKPGAQRYTYTRLHKNFHKYVKDLDLVPSLEDPSYLPPLFYIPVIPLVLANGVKGVATGFATSILPRSQKDLTAACLEYITTGDIASKIQVTFPEFRGTVELEAETGRWICYGLMTRKGKTMVTIEEVPYGFDRETYVSILDELEEKGMIVEWTDHCSKDGFRFEVKLKNETGKMSDDKLANMFKLVKPFSENLTVLDHNGRLKIYSDERDLVKDFVDYRMTILTKRIEKRIEEIELELRWLMVKAAFISAVVEDRIEVRRRTKKDLVADIRNSDIVSLSHAASEEEAERLLRLSISSLTSEDIKELEKQTTSLLTDLKSWQNTTPKKQFLIDLKDLDK